MPTYAALIYSPAGSEGQGTSEDWARVMAEYNAFGEEAGAAGVIAGGEALEDTANATTIHVDGAKGGTIVTTDGPFAETKGHSAASICSPVPTSTRRSVGRPGSQAHGTARSRFVLWSISHRGSDRAGPRSRVAPGPRVGVDSGCDRDFARRGVRRRGHRLATDRRPVPDVGADGAGFDHAHQPRGRRVEGVRTGARPRPARRGRGGRLAPVLGDEGGAAAAAVGETFGAW